MKRWIAMLLCAAVFCVMLPVPVYGDMGPKPSVVIDFEGLDGTAYYVTLLSEKETTGPFTALNDGNASYAHYQEGDDGYEIFLKFVEYQDADGFYFLQYFQDCTQTQQFQWTYYPPQAFKVLLYFPDTDEFLVSGQIYERYAFDSYFTADVSGVEGLSVLADAGIVLEKSYQYGWEVLSLLVRILLTILIELAVALLFGFREKKQFLFLVYVNTATQVLLNVLLNIINYQAGWMAFFAFYVLLELFVFAVEAVLYSVYMKKFGKKPVPGWKPVLYAFVANAASFGAGAAIARWMPGVIL